MTVHYLPPPPPRFTAAPGQILDRGAPIPPDVAIALLDALYIAAFLSDDPTYTIRINREARELGEALDALNAWRLA